MGSLGSCDGVGLFLSWIMSNSGTSSNEKSDRKKKFFQTTARSDSVGVWKTIVATSKYGLGLFASGAPLKIHDFLSADFDFYNVSRSGGGGGFSWEHQHWTRWLHMPIQDHKNGGMGSPFNWNFGTRKSGSWRLFPSGLGGPPENKPSRGTLVITGAGSGAEGAPSNSTDNGYPRGTLTYIILGLNALVFLGQIASKGRLLLYGAKINSLIDQGQLWRLLTPSVLHANIFHLLINSYSLNSIGPTVESLAGPRRFVAVYSASAVTSTTLSYFCCSAPSVGASGAIFGLVGALAVFLIRHKNMMVNGQQSLQQVARVIAINLVLGLVSDGIDNWSHFGGLLGGAAVTWLLGPVYRFEVPPGGGQKQLVDRPPISYLLPSRFQR
ncbi:unnamed protein product [Calypogeia fissa]